MRPLLVAAAFSLLLFAVLPRGGAEETSPGPGPRPLPWAVAAMPDGSAVFAACGPWKAVARVDLDGGAVSRFPVAGTPRGLALAPDGRTLAVTLGPEDIVVLLDAATGEVRASIPVEGAPEGIGFLDEGRCVAVACRLREDVALVDLETQRVVSRSTAGREPFGLAVSPDGTTVAVVSRRANVAHPDDAPESEVTILDAKDLRVRHRVTMPSCHLSEALAFTTDGSRVLVPAIRVRNLLPVLQVARGWVLSSVLGIVDPATGAYADLPLTDLSRGFADPAGIAVTARHAYIASGGANELGVIDLEALLAHEDEGRPGLPERLDHTPRWVVRRVETATNPRGVVAFARDGRTLIATTCRIDGAIQLRVEGEGAPRSLPLEPPRPDDEIHRGMRAFVDASMCFQHAFSCASCHPEAHTDGLTYDFEIDGVGEHVVLNRSLQGLKGTEPYKWTGINPSLQRQCGARFAMVLTRADVFPKQDLDAMAAYLLSLPPPRPLIDVETADEATRAGIARGKAIFERSRGKHGKRLRPSQRCITCHSPPHFTNRQRTDVGTRGERDPTGAFDTSHLKGIGRKAPYLHDGRALRLEDIWTAKGVGDKHGFVSDLTSEELSDMILYLKTL